MIAVPASESPTASQNEPVSSANVAARNAPTM